MGVFIYPYLQTMLAKQAPGCAMWLQYRFHNICPTCQSPISRHKHIYAVGAQYCHNADALNFGHNHHYKDPNSSCFARHDTAALIIACICTKCYFRAHRSLVTLDNGVIIMF